MTTKEYPKPYLSEKEQIEHMASRGMHFADKQSAAFQLRHIGYYRLSAYCYPFRKADTGKDGRLIVYDEYREDTNFETIIQLYIFDRKLRLLFLDAIERIEVSLRTSVSLITGKICKHHHLNPDNLDGNFTKKTDHKGETKYEVWAKHLKNKIKRSNEEFLKHFIDNYPDTKMPIWISSELWDYGMLSHYISGLKLAEAKEISKTYAVDDQKVFMSWIRTLNDVRNFSAHHCRLWNRPLLNQPKYPKEGTIQELEHAFKDVHTQTRLYAAACITQYFMKTICQNTEWPQRLNSLIESFPNNKHISIKDAGFFEKWYKEPLWQE